MVKSPYAHTFCVVDIAYCSIIDFTRISSRIEISVHAGVWKIDIRCCSGCYGASLLLPIAGHGDHDYLWVIPE